MGVSVTLARNACKSQGMQVTGECILAMLFQKELQGLGGSKHIFLARTGEKLYFVVLRGKRSQTGAAMESKRCL